MVDGRSVLGKIARADFHHGGWRTRRLFDVEPGFFADLAADIRRLATENMPSEVAAVDHVTHWTRPVGRAVQFSLLNASGDFADTSVDHDKKVSGKRFHHAAAYPTLGRFVELLPGATNLRLNGMAPGGGLSPHEEHVVRRDGRTYYLRARFHLPIATNPEALVLLDGQWFHLDEGSVYFFNNGCIHSAVNNGETQRYHLVWDMTLTEDVVEYMFGAGSHGPLERVPETGQTARIHHTEHVDEYAISGAGARLYRKARIERLGIKPHVWQNQYQKVAYRAYATVGRLDFDTFR